MEPKRITPTRLVVSTGKRDETPKAHLFMAHPQPRSRTGVNVLLVAFLIAIVIVGVLGTLWLQSLGS